MQDRPVYHMPDPAAPNFFPMLPPHPLCLRPPSSFPGFSDPHDMDMGSGARVHTRHDCFAQLTTVAPSKGRGAGVAAACGLV